MSAAVPSLLRKRKLSHEINVVPYIDVMLVLLIIFMVTAPLLTPGIEVELPKVTAESIQQNDEPVSLYVNGKGEFFLDVGEGREDALAEDEVMNRVGAVLRNKPETMILVRADARADYESVARGMGLLQAAGASKIGFVTDAPDPKPRN
ncbi:MAG: protein TolR [Pseudomonadota bacterium]|jgi:biopolymer transport protein TolR|nr:protein TolR [Pseudomonadota bacterium]